MAPNAGNSKRKRDRTKDRQRSKEKRQQEQFEDSEDLDSLGLSDDEEDIDPSSIYGPKGEKKWQWDARVGNQPVYDASWAAFERRAKARRGKPIEYEHPTFAEEQVLHLAEPSKVKSCIERGDKKVRQLSFGPNINVNGAVIDILANADADFRAGLHAFIAGDLARVNAIELTDADVERLVKACPKLKVITLHSTSHLGAEAFPKILLGCADIEAVTITTVNTPFPTDTKLTEKLDWLSDKDWVTKLRFLEFRGVYLDPKHRNFLDFLTKRRPALEIIFEWQGHAAFIRDMESVPLARVPKRAAAGLATGAASSGKSKVEDDDEAWETEEEEEEWDDGLISNDPKANARMLRKLGQQAAMSNALGRPLYDFEMDSDYGDYDLDLDSEDDEGLTPQEMRKMLQIMRMMNNSH